MRGRIAIQSQGFGGDRYSATLWHCIARVEQDVQYRHLQMRWIDADRRQPSFEACDQPDLATYRILQQLAEIIDEGVEVNVTWLQPRPSRERQQLPRKPRSAVC